VCKRWQSRTFAASVCSGAEQNHTDLPIPAIQKSITRPCVVSKEALDGAPDILSAQDNRLIYGSDGRVRVRSLQPLLADDHYSVFRPGEVLVDPANHELLGYEAILVSDATVLKTGDLSTVILENNEREALKGDRLLPLDEDEDPAFFPGAPEHETSRVIISLFDSIRQIGQHQIVFLNMGAQWNWAGTRAGRLLDWTRSAQSLSVRRPEQASRAACGKSRRNDGVSDFR
jgi:hypothetical protein